MDIEEFRQRGKDMVDFICTYYETLSSRRVYPDVEPGFMTTLFPSEAPKKPDQWDSIINDVKEILIPGLTHWQHPHFHAYFANGLCSASILGSFLADALACLGFSWASSPSVTELEEITCDWLAKAFGLPSHFIFHSPNSNGGGVIQSSASECVLICLIAARAQAIQYLKEQSKEPELDDTVYLAKLVAYTSTEAHSCLEKAAKIAMVKLRVLEPDDECSLRGPVLAEAIEEDIKSGYHPFFVSCTLGTTSSAGFDNLKEIGPICVKFPALWLHVDAAYAGNGFICPELRYLKEGLEFADSFNTNANKWLLVGFDCSLLWVKDRYKLTTALMVDPLYLRYDHMNDSIDFRHWGITLSRKFRALKLFFVLRDLGVEGIQSKIRNDIKMAKEFEAMVIKDSRFEICNIVRTGLVCFRLNATDEINEELIGSINREGKLHLTPSRVKDKFVLRFCVIHPYSDINLIRNAWSIIQEHAASVLALGDPAARRVSGESTKTHAESRRFSFVLPVPQDVYDEQSSKKTLKDDTMPVLVVDDEAVNDTGLDSFGKVSDKQPDSHFVSSAI